MPGASRRSALPAGGLVLLAVVLAGGTSAAQVKTHGYVSAGAGATDVNGGMDWAIAGGPVGIGFDAGIGWVALGAFTSSYHLLARHSQRHDLFPTVGWAVLASDELTSQGVSIGGGWIWWPWRHVGLRLDGFKFLPVTTDHRVPVEELSSSRYWGARAGMAFRFR
jgi:hypothetical protein